MVPDSLSDEDKDSSIGSWSDDNSDEEEDEVSKLKSAFASSSRLGDPSSDEEEGNDDDDEDEVDLSAAFEFRCLPLAAQRCIPDCHCWLDPLQLSPGTL